MRKRKLTWGDIALITAGFVFLVMAVSGFASRLLFAGMEGILKAEFWGEMACPLVAAAFFLFVGFRGRVDIKPENENSDQDQGGEPRP